MYKVVATIKGFSIFTGEAREIDNMALTLPKENEDDFEFASFMGEMVSAVMRDAISMGDFNDRLKPSEIVLLSVNVHHTSDDEEE